MDNIITIGDVFELIIVISVFLLMIKSFKIQKFKNKEYIEKLRREGNLKNPGRGLLYSLLILILAYISGIVITLIIFYVNKMVFDPSRILSIALIIVIIEICICASSGYLMKFIKTCKEEGIKRAVLYLIITLILLAGFLYIKYKF